ncbi:uncharacterized protein LOC123529525 isoform X1 [Mercenaria mercenaria]|uniref:uncharacterized protein LOC123529525 isoform X1 n=1 Tax=Mercenaria mercenaria TaxID=6596 RepID=UPI00234F8442|nr:uncharacterized protein LOC123529525 isoform X1 [Mercenaria mercenaria]
MSRPYKILKTGEGMWRKKQQRIDESEVFILDQKDDDRNPLVTAESVASLAVELGETTSSDSFQNEVTHKTNTFLIGRQEAETEVFTDVLVRQKGGVDKALLYVISDIKIESKISVLGNNLINRGASTSTTDSDLKTPLHHAVTRNFKGVVTKLLDNDALPQARDKNGTLPLKIAMDNKNYDMCALLLAYMPNAFVRGLFLSHGNCVSEFSIHDLLRTEINMQKTILSILDCLIETRGSTDRLRVFYDLLECDEDGRTPTDSNFIEKSRSPLQVIAKQGNKNIVYHDAVRLLTRRKWKLYAKRRFELNSFLYIIGLFCITYSAIVAVTTPKPNVYKGPLQISRAVFEVLSLVMVAQTLSTEISQLRRHKLEYFHDTFNWFELSSAILLVFVVPLRFTHNNVQWHVFAFGYIFWTIRIFKFAAVFRQIGAYTQILARIIAHDFIQFGVVFFVILLAFSVSFFLFLRGDKDLDTHNETSTFWGILFVGIRSLTEAQPVVDYTGDDGYGKISVIFMLCFLFTCIVILLNILIAQLTDTYQKVQQDAQRGLEVNRAWIVARVELNTFFFGKNFRRFHYKAYEDIENLKDVLTKWESPPLNEMNKYVKDIWDTLDNHKMNLLTIQHRLVRQENTLRNMQDQLSCVVAMLKASSSDPSDTDLPSSQTPKFCRSDTEQNGYIRTNDTTNASTRRKHLHKEKSIALDDVQAVNGINKDTSV